MEHIALILFIAIWLGVRSFGLTGFRYLMGFPYDQYDILDLIAYALTINLVFTLFTKIPKTTTLNQIVNTAIQSLLIGIIVLLPKYGDPDTLGRIGGGNKLLVFDNSNRSTIGFLNNIKNQT